MLPEEARASAQAGALEIEGLDEEGEVLYEGRITGDQLASVPGGSILDGWAV